MSPSREFDDLKKLRQLAADVEPPGELEEQVVSELRQRGLIGSTQGQSGRSWRHRLAVAAGLVVAALGGWLARGVAEAGLDSTPPPAGREYMLILTEPDGLDTDKSLAELVGEYRDWAGGLIAENRLVTMRRLDRGGQDLMASGERQLEASPTPRDSEATGFFLVRAASLDEAMAVAESCPHLGYGGRVSVSEVARGAG